VRNLKLPFYLTGGTALSRHYFFHRYSDDLDLFVNEDDRFDEYLLLLFDELGKEERKKIIEFDNSSIRKSKDFAQIFVSAYKSDVNLKIDLVNDISARFGRFEKDRILGKIDSWRNILSNKLSSLTRLEPKDVADIVIIAKNKNFNWKHIITEAKEKDGSVDPITICEILNSFPMDFYKEIKWIHKIEKTEFISCLKIIAGDIFKGLKNNLKDK